MGEMMRSSPPVTGISTTRLSTPEAKDVTEAARTFPSGDHAGFSKNSSGNV
jgi:hypothetical protein